MLVPSPVFLERTLAPDNENQEIHDRIAAIYWNRIGGSGGNVQFDYSMATIFFVKTRKGYFGITNNHVYEGYINANTDSWLRMETYINNIEIELDGRCISSNKELDLATFRFDKIEIESFGVKVFDYSKGEWGTSVIIKNGFAAFGGFPVGRRYENHDSEKQDQPEIYFDKLVYLGELHNILEDKISLAWEWNERRISDGNRAISNSKPLPKIFDLGGFSGAPLLFRSKRRHIADGWELGGVIFEGKNLTDIGPDLFYARPIRFISEDGKILNL